MSSIGLLLLVYIVGLLLLCPYPCRYVKRPLDDCDFSSRASGVCKLVARHSCSILRRPCCSTSSYIVEWKYSRMMGEATGTISVTANPM